MHKEQEIETIPVCEKHDIDKTVKVRNNGRTFIYCSLCESERHKAQHKKIKKKILIVQ